MDEPKIVVVDDQEVNVALLEDILQQAGYTRVHSTTNPARVLSMYGEIRPDLVLLDLAMPGLDGFAVLEQLRPVIGDDYVPILVLTADLTPQAKERALRGGAKDFLAKPFDVTEVMLRIANLIETRMLHRRLQDHAGILEERVRERTRELEDEVAERKQAELALRESEDRYRQLIESTSDLVSTLASDGRFLFANRAFIETLGYSAGEILSLCLWDVVPAEQRAPIQGLLDKVFGEGAKEEVLSSLVGKGGRTLSVEGNLTLGHTRDGSRCVHAFLRDVTERERLERVRREKELAEASSSAKSEMLANMSHELRTPLNSIIGFGRVLEGGSYGPLTARQSLYVHNIVRAGEHMLGLVNDLLDFRKIEGKTARLDIGPVPVGAAIADAAMMVAAVIAERRHSLSSRVAEGAPDALADHDALVQVLVNLLSNAAKYTEPGGSIEVRVSAAEGAVKVEVEDRGIGIRAEDQERIFDYFVQLGGKRGQSMNGYGIGLALTRKLVEAMGGSIGVRSAPGEGSVFWFTLPAAPARGDQ